MRYNLLSDKGLARSRPSSSRVAEEPASQAWAACSEEGWTMRATTSAAATAASRADVVFHFVSTKFFRLFRCKAEEFCGLIHYCRKELQWRA